MLSEIKKIAVSTKPVQYLLNTSADADHIGGNEALGKALGSANTWTIINTPGGSQTAVKILAHDNVAEPNEPPPRGSRAERDLRRTREGDSTSTANRSSCITSPTAHTDGDSIVFFRRSDVVATGDIFRTDSYPVIDLQKGGSVQGVIDGLNLVLDLAVPAHHEEGGTYVVPGHGRISDEFDVLEYRDMVTIVRDRVQALIKKGMTLEAGEGGAADARLRLALRRDDWELDDRHVRRSGVQEPFTVARRPHVEVAHVDALRSESHERRTQPHYLDTADLRATCVQPTDGHSRRRHSRWSVPHRLAIHHCGDSELREAQRRARHLARVALPLADPNVLVGPALGLPLLGASSY